MSSYVVTRADGTKVVRSQSSDGSWSDKPAKSSSSGVPVGYEIVARPQITDTRTGRVVQEASSRIVSSSTGKELRRTSSPKSQVAAESGTIVVEQRDTKKGTTTKTVTDVPTERWVSEQRPTTPPRELRDPNFQQQQFVNQGTVSRQPPTIQTQTQSGGTISPSVRPSAQEILRSQKYQEAGPVKRFFMKDWTVESQAQYNQFQLRGGTASEGKYIFTAAGAGMIANFQNIGLFCRALYESPVQTISQGPSSIDSMPGAIAQGAKENPAGLIGSFTSDALLFRTSSVVTGAARAKLTRPKVIDNNPSTVRTIQYGDTVRTQGTGSFQVQTGTFRKKTQDFTYESFSDMRKVETPDVPRTPTTPQSQIPQQRQNLISDTPSSARSPTSSSTAVSDPFLQVKKSRTDPIPSQSPMPPAKEIYRGDITTTIRDSKGKVIDTQKLPAELVREQGKQTLFVDGKPFNIHQKTIDTPKGLGIASEKGVTAFTPEGAFGLSRKQQTTQTITTDSQGRQSIAYTQRAQAFEQPFFRQRPETQSQIPQQRQNLIADKIQDIKFTEPSQALSDPLVTVRRDKTRQPKQTQPDFSGVQITEGISMPLQPQGFGVTKSPTRTIQDGTITGESSLFRKQLQDKSQGQLELQNQFKLESPTGREARVVEEVFGRDFLERAKRKPDPITVETPSRTTDSTQRFSSGPYEQIFDQKTKTINIEIGKQQPPSQRTRTQQMNPFDEPTPRARSASKPTTPDSIVIDVRPGASFVPRQSFRGVGIVAPRAPESAQTTQQFLDIGKVHQMPQDTIPRTRMSFEQAPGFKRPQMPAQDFIFEQEQIFKQDQPYKPRTSQTFSPTQPVPMRPTSPRVTPPPVRTPKKLSFDIPKAKQSRKQGDDMFSMGDGRYVGSLGGVLLNKTLKNPPKKLTGLEIRGIRL